MGKKPKSVIPINGETQRLSRSMVALCDGTGQRYERLWSASHAGRRHRIDEKPLLGAQHEAPNSTEAATSRARRVRLEPSHVAVSRAPTVRPPHGLGCLGKLVAHRRRVGRVAVELPVQVI